jgi:hypothetical protein
MDEVYDNEEKKVEALRGLVTSPLWGEVLEPTIRKKASEKLEDLLRGGGQDDITRGWVAALRWMLDWPQAMIKEHDIDNERQKLYASDDARIATLAEYGRGGPFVETGHPYESEVV